MADSPGPAGQENTLSLACPPSVHVLEAAQRTLGIEAPGQL